MRGLLAPLIIFLVTGAMMINRVWLIFNMEHPAHDARPPAFYKWPRHRIEAWIWLVFGAFLLSLSITVATRMALLSCGVTPELCNEIAWFQATFGTFAGLGLLAQLCGFTQVRFDALNQQWERDRKL